MREMCYQRKHHPKDLGTQIQNLDVYGQCYPRERTYEHEMENLFFKGVFFDMIKSYFFHILQAIP